MVLTTGTRSAAYEKLFLLRYGAAQPDIRIVNNGMKIAASDSIPFLENSLRNHPNSKQNQANRI